MLRTTDVLFLVSMWLIGATCRDRYLIATLDARLDALEAQP